LKKNLALAHVDPALAPLGTTLKIEQTVEYERHMVTATVVKKPFFDPPRKRK
jgi:glycine cleavage system aminomethyltransferase T